MSEPLRCMLWLTAMACALSAHAGPVTKIEARGALAAPTTLNYGRAFNDLNAVAPGVQITQDGVPITLQAGEVFHELYAFTAGPATVSFIALTIDLGNVFNIDGLMLSVYEAAGLAAAVLGDGFAPPSTAPLALSVAAPRSGPGEQQVIAPLALPAGRYVLEVQGRVTGVSGGSYSGVINVAAVPEPTSLSLVMAAAGLALLPASASARRRRPHPAAGVRMDHG